MAFKNFGNGINNSDPLSDSILIGFLCEVLSIFENFSVFSWAFWIFSGIPHVCSENLSTLTKIHLSPSLFDVLYSAKSAKSILHLSRQNCIIFLLVGYFFMSGLLNFHRWRFKRYPFSFSLRKWEALLNCRRYCNKFILVPLCRWTFFDNVEFFADGELF